MKTATLPPLRVEPALRSEAERLLREGETLSSFVLDAVAACVRERQLEDEFVARGLASAASARRTGKYATAASVLARLRGRLDCARQAAARAQGEGRSAHARPRKRSARR